MENFITSGASHTLSKVIFGFAVFFFVLAIVAFIYVLRKYGENKDATFHASAYFICTCLLLCTSMLSSFTWVKAINPQRPGVEVVSTKNIGLLIQGILPIIEAIGLVALLAYIAFLVFQIIKYYKNHIDEIPFKNLRKKKVVIDEQEDSENLSKMLKNKDEGISNEEYKIDQAKEVKPIVENSPFDKVDDSPFKNPTSDENDTKLNPDDIDTRYVNF